MFLSFLLIYHWNDGTNAVLSSSLSRKEPGHQLSEKAIWLFWVCIFNSCMQFCFVLSSKSDIAKGWKVDYLNFEAKVLN